MDSERAHQGPAGPTLGLHSFLPWEHLPTERLGLDVGRSSCLRPASAWSLACELGWAPHSTQHTGSVVAPGWRQVGPEEDLIPGGTAGLVPCGPRIPGWHLCTCSSSLTSNITSYK